MKIINNKTHLARIPSCARMVLFLAILIAGLSFSTKLSAQKSMWVGETYKCDATSAVMGLTSDVSWTTNGGYLSLSGSGFYRNVTVTQYFGGSATVKCSWKYRLYSGDTWKTQSKSWTITCNDNPVSISPTSLTLNVGQTGRVGYNHKYNNSYTSYANAYFSSGSSCVSVSSNGEITALHAGIAYVNVNSKISSVSPYCTVTVIESSDPNPNQNSEEYDIVDLGLSVNWANKNIGAEDEYDDGDTFLWGEIKKCDNWYVPTSQYLNIETFNNYYNGTYNLPKSMDAATYNMGENWRMPTKKEFEELMDNCQWEKYYKNGLYGYKVTGPNGKSIYLPGDHRPQFYNLYYTNSAIPRTGSMDDDRLAYALLVASSNYKIDKITRITALMIRGVTKSMPSGIVDIVDEDNNTHVEYFNLNGIRINTEALTPGLYIKRQGNKSTKVFVK